MRLLAVSRFFCLLALLAAGYQAFADVKVTGMYSNMTISGGEDLSGMEIFITGASNGYHALVQCAKSEPMPPVLVTVTVSEPNISFNLPPVEKTGCEGTKAKGKITLDGLELSFGDRYKPTVIKRGLSFWSKSEGAQD